MTTGIIDADSIPFICACHPEVESRYYYVSDKETDNPEYVFSGRYGLREAEEFALSSGLTKDNVFYRRELISESRVYELVQDYTDNVLRLMGVDDYTLYLGGKTNFRYQIYSKYKSTRKKYERPPALDGAIKFLISNYGAIVVEGIEADDAAAIDVLKTPGAILGTNDKDLDQIPGDHFDIRQLKHYHVSQDQALLKLYSQILTGDKVDDIPGIKGIGPARALGILRNCRTERDMWEAVKRTYKNDKLANLNASLIYILRHEGDSWESRVRNLYEL